MIERLYVRVARRRHIHSGSMYKIDASPSHNPRPLEVGGYPLKTIHFAIDVELPSGLFNDPEMPVVKLTVDPGEGFMVEPTVVQVGVTPPTDEAPHGNHDDDRVGEG
jgi:hypothetical protein